MPIFRPGRQHPLAAREPPQHWVAFYVDNGPHLPLWDRLPALAFWLLPSAVAIPLIARAIRRSRPGAARDGRPGS